MKNFKEIAEKCLNGELSGTFVCVIGKTNGKIVNVSSKGLQKLTNFWPYIFVLNYSDKEVSYDRYDRFGISEYGTRKVINFIPDMKENDKRIIQVSLQQAREWYNSGNDTLKTLALSSFSKEEIDPYPRSWDEFEQIYGKEVFTLSFNYFKVSCKLMTNIDSYIKLLLLRKEWIHVWSQEQSLKKDWKPRHDRFEPSIYRDSTDNSSVCMGLNISLSFPTIELAQDFLNTFKDLLDSSKGLY